MGPRPPPRPRRAHGVADGAAHAGPLPQRQAGRRCRGGRAANSPMATATTDGHPRRPGEGGHPSEVHEAQAQRHGRDQLAHPAGERRQGGEEPVARGGEPVLHQAQHVQEGEAVADADQGPPGQGRAHARPPSEQGLARGQEHERHGEHPPGPEAVGHGPGGDLQAGVQRQLGGHERGQERRARCGSGARRRARPPPGWCGGRRRRGRR